MNEQLVCRRLRKEFDKVGVTMLLYYGIMSYMVFAVMLMQQTVLMFSDMDDAAMEAALVGNGWGYIFAICTGCVILLLWKKPEFCFRTIWQPRQKMKLGSFVVLLCIFLSGQAVFLVLSFVLEALLNLVGLSITESMEAATGLGDTFSMFLYGCVFAPVFEEVLFRGLLLRMMEPYGKKFAILTTAFLFGLFHANIVQSPFAFAVGLVLGYVAIEYSMAWAIILHLINNLVMGDLLYRLTAGFEPWVQEVIFYGIVGIATLAAIIILICKHHSIRDYVCTKKIHPWCLKSFFTSPGILTFSILMTLSVVATLVMQWIV